MALSRAGIGIVVAGLLTWSARADAQDRSPQVGGFLQWSVFDNSLRIDDFFAGGAHVGVPLIGAFGVEADIAHVTTNGPPTVKVTYLPIHARLTYAIPVWGSATAMLGAGYVHNWYGASRDGSDNGISGLAGVRFRLTDRLGARFDFVADYMPSPVNAPAADANWNLGLRQGLFVSLGRRSRTEVADVPTATLAPATNPDRDGDGVDDGSDRCLSTPAATIVDASGCPLDTDADGVTDRLDRCPNTPAGTAVDASGCPLDSDRDGVTDRLDRCFNTPAGTAVDAAGCPLDSDGDGVPDASDRCAATPIGTRVDATGCLVLFAENKKSLVLEGVNFANGKAVLTEESKTILDNVAASLVANAQVRVRVEGHTSSTGARALNVRLSHERAEAVKAYLVQRGVTESQLVARGFGPDRPIASNTTAEGQAKNRRVELVKLD